MPILEILTVMEKTYCFDISGFDKHERDITRVFSSKLLAHMNHSHEILFINEQLVFYFNEMPTETLHIGVYSIHP